MVNQESQHHEHHKNYIEILLPESIVMSEKKLESIQVVGLGQVCVDYVGRVPTYPPEDTKMEMDGLFSSCGGPAATALVTLTRSGVPCSFLGSISDDPFGVQIVRTLKKEGVNTSFLKIAPGLNSQFAFIVVSGSEGKRTIFWNRSSAPELSPMEFSLHSFPKARVLHLDGLMLDAGKEAARQARSLGMTVVMDAGTVRDGTLDMIPGVDILIASQAFADAFTGPDVPRQKAVECLRELGPKQVVITLGAKGSIGLDRGGIVRQEAFPVASIDTTGAGDVYHGAYIFGFLKGWNMGRCMAFASAAAALKCRNGGGWDGIPDLRAIQNLMKESPGKCRPVQ